MIFFLGYLRRFQSTRPRGARQQRFIKSRFYMGFNPRARGERDLNLSATLPSKAFQSTRPRGARHDDPLTAQA